MNAFHPHQKVFAVLFFLKKVNFLQSGSILFHQGCFLRYRAVPTDSPFDAKIAHNDFFYMQNHLKNWHTQMACFMGSQIFWCTKISSVSELWFAHFCYNPWGPISFRCGSKITKIIPFYNYGYQLFSHEHSADKALVFFGLIVNGSFGGRGGGST